MRILLLTCFAVFLFSCNSSSKKDPGQAMDDTARMDTPPANTLNFTIEPVKILASDIPVSIKVKGKIQAAWKWTDKQGDNILITTHVEPYDDKRKNEYGEEGQTAELHAVLFLKKGDRYENIWMLNDEEKSCPFDITCAFIENSTTITDLDKDGFAEVKLQYSLACRSDVSPATMKIMIYENGEKYSLSGLMWLPYSPDFKYDVTEKDVNLENVPKLKDETEEMLRSFGRYQSEKDFTKAPSEFLTFARTEWLKYSKEKMGE